MMGEPSESRMGVAGPEFHGWAKVEVMGHQSHIGYVRTEAYGQAVMFRVDTPGLEEREYVLEQPAFVDGSWTPAGATVKRAAVAGCSVLVGAASIYRIVPCEEAVAMHAIERERRTELKLVALPAGMCLPGPGDAIDEEGDEVDEEYEDGEE